MSYLSEIRNPLNSLKIFKSSAGSGKTFTLVKEYLKLVLTQPEDYRSILAITFTNKAAEEMKGRIVDALVDLSSGKDSDLLKILQEELPKINIRVKAEKALRNILHDYSSFSVSTIDSFFQRILRALAREIHLPLKMEVEVSTEEVVLAVTDSILRQVGTDSELTEWLTDLALQKMSEEKGWNIENDISVVAGELFKEEHHNKKILSREEIKKIYGELSKIRKSFIAKMKNIGDRGLEIISGAGFSVNDFSYKESGVAGYFLKISKPKDNSVFAMGKLVKKGITNPDTWTVKKSEFKNVLDNLVNTALLPLLREAEIIIDNEYKEFVSANEVLKKIYLFGLVNDLQEKFREYRRENNVILLSDTTKLLGDIVEGNDTPFVYEKTGNRFKHLLIDEFQDTSLLQWKNLLPLVINALGSGFMTLVVGDAKQSIYRWRGGNMNLLIRDIFSDLSNFKSLIKPENLSTNYRSKKEIVSFNNQFFINASEIINTQPDMNDHPILRLAYGNDLSQNIAKGKDEGGYVNVNFISSDDASDEDGEELKWKDIALNNLLTSILNQLDNGFSFRDIAILVRKNTEGNEIATFLINNGIDKIISPDSLLITGSPRINFLVNTLRFLADQKNAIARAEILYYYAINIADLPNDKHSYFSDHKNFKYKGKTGKHSTTLFPPESLNESDFNSILPESFTGHLNYLANLPIYEISEHLVEIFKLNKKPDAYIQRFQDLVLEYNTGFDSSLEGFLKWWDSSKRVRNASVITPQNEDAIQIMTIHRSKGLQFPIVYIPFCDWKIIPKPNELIWLETDQTPFKELGKTALVTSNNLKETYYSKDYLEEINQTVIDNLNMLYVAFTRAEEKLLIYCPADNKKDLNTVSKLIARTCSKLDPEAKDIFIRGENFEKKKKDDRSSETMSVNLQIYPSNRWQNKLSLTSHGNDLIEMLGKKDISKTNYGILIHALLAESKGTSEVIHLADKFVFEGLITEQQKTELLNEVDSVLKVEEISSLFSSDYQIKSEKDMILPNGEVLRPDRVIIKNNEAIVIDFKSGAPQIKHEDQVKQYADVLRKMGYSKVESKLVYLSSRTVLNV